MIEAARLTRAGDLAAADAMIQRALRRRTFAVGADADDHAVEIEAREVVATAEGATACAKLPPARVPATIVEPVIHGSRFVSGRLGQGRGTREFRLFIPSATGDATSRPLVVMLHGCTQDPQDFAVATQMNELARAQSLYVLYPSQSLWGNPQLCWNWFKTGHQKRDQGEPALLVEMTRRTIANYAVDPSRVYVAGLAAGGAMAAILGQAYPDIFAAVGVHSDDAPGSAGDSPGAFAAMQGQGGQAALLRMPTIMFQGKADATTRSYEGGPSFGSFGVDQGALQSASERLHRSRSGSTRRARSTWDGRRDKQHWIAHGDAPAWRSRDPSAICADSDAADASGEMLRFFLQHRLARST